MSTPLSDRPDRARFELDLGAAVAFIDYRREGSVLWLTHAEVPAALEGQGHGGRLVRAVLDEVRARGERVVPRCPFIAAWIARHPDYRDLLAAR